MAFISWVLNFTQNIINDIRESKKNKFLNKYSVVKKILKSALTILAIIGISMQPAQGQIKVFFSDLLNGTINGVALGGATMALQNSGDMAPLRVGTGIGILYGAGIGIYDVTRTPKGQPLYISGTFNSGKNSTVIVLLDTFYGAAAGAAIGAAVTLISGNYIVDGLQYGSGAGAWVGFGFGLIDSFVLSEGPEELMASGQSSSSSPVAGIIRYSSPSDKINIGLLHPTVMAQPIMKGGTLQAQRSFGVEVINLNVSF